ncbi:MAG: hypothetical protein ACREA1_05530 [Nitrosotalea sp.]
MQDFININSTDVIKIANPATINQNLFSNIPKTDNIGLLNLLEHMLFKSLYG